MALTATLSPTPVRDGDTLLLTGDVTITVGTTRDGEPDSPGEIARLALFDAANGMRRPLPPERRQSATRPEPGRVAWAGRTRPSVLGQDDREGDVWTFRYATGFEWGRLVRLQVVAWDHEGRELGAVTLDHARIANHGGFVAPVAARDASGPRTLASLAEAPVAGVLELEVRAHRVDQLRTTRRFPELPYEQGWREEQASGPAHVALQLFVDGWPVPRYDPRVPNEGGYATTDPVTGAAEYRLAVDTTRHANGRRRITIVASSVAPDAQDRYRGPGGTVELPVVWEADVVVRNPARPVALVPRFRTVWLRPGETVANPCVVLDADGRRAGVDGSRLRVTTADARVATADGDGIRAGRGLEDAVTWLTYALADAPGAPPATVRVVVTARASCPHFTRSGKIRQTFAPGESTFVVNLFQWDAAAFRSPATASAPSRGETDHEWRLAEAARAAGFNALGAGFFSNPSRGARVGWDAWRAGQDRLLADVQGLLARHPWLLWYPSGDDVLRARQDFHWTATSEYGLRAVTYAFQRLVDTGRVVAVDMVDEVNGLLGATPDPDAPWRHGDRPIPADAVRRIVAAAKATRGGTIPLAFPVLGRSGPANARTWMGAGSPSDFASIYATTFVPPARSDYWPLAVVRDGMDRALERWPVRYLAPRVAIAGGMGEFYNQYHARDFFTPGWDWPASAVRVGTRVEQAPASVWRVVGDGCAGVRLYSFDSVPMRQARERPKPLPHYGEQQTGFSPTVQPDMWAAFGNACSLVQELLPLVLQPSVHALALHPDVVTGEKRGPAGRLFTVQNWSDRLVTVPVDAGWFAPYRGGRSWRLHGGERYASAVDTLPAAWTLAPGEVLVLAREG